MLPTPVDSILEAVFTVSPNRQYLGILDPTIPATTGPVWAPDLINYLGLKKKLLKKLLVDFKQKSIQFDSLIPDDTH